MTTNCDLDVVLYFYDEMRAEDRTRMEAHLRGCAACRQRLEDLQAIKHALASQPVVDAPPAGDWAGFMRRLDAAVAADRSSEGLRRSGSPPRSLARRFAGSLRFRLRQGYGGRAEASSARRRARGSLTAFARVAAAMAVVTIGLFIASRIRAIRPDAQTANTQSITTAKAAAGKDADTKAGLRALRENSAEHLERSKLVVLGLATRDAEHTKAADWQYERQLAGTLLSDTRLYRLAAQERGAPDVARVMRDLETVLLEASMTDSPDRESLERVQRLIAKRDLVSKMRIVAAAGTAGL